jgi:pyruvate kinase
MKAVRNTHIICTIGPAVNTVDLVRGLLRRGMNIARFNFSHGDHAAHKEAIDRVRQAAEAEGVPAALMLDTKGPEIRTGVVQGRAPVLLAEGEDLEVIAEAEGSRQDGPDGALTRKGRITVSYEALAEDLRQFDQQRGAKILIADGLMALDVLAVEGRRIRCRVSTGGELGSRKNVNITGVHTRLPALSEQDKQDLRFGHEQSLDVVAASFIRKAQDVITIQKFLASIGSNMPVIAKIEDEEGLNNIEDIIRVAGGVMVARGDLGVQIPPERVPLEQKRIISLCNAWGKPVITATQMLDSMIHNPRPTRAEAGDVANAVLDGTDCVMLSGETANGAHPLLAVEVMDRIARTAEASQAYEDSLNQRRLALGEDRDLGQVIARAASLTADTIGASCIIVPTMTGHTAQLISKYRPRLPIVAAAWDPKVRRRLLLSWGVAPVPVQQADNSESMIQGAISAAIGEGFAKTADKVVVAAGLPLHSPFTTNSIRVHVIGNILGRGFRGFGGRCTGRIFKAQDLPAASSLLRKQWGEILLTHTLDESFIPIIRIVKGVILEGMSELSKEMLATVNPRIVYIGQVPNAMDRFEDYITVTLDGDEKIIYEGSMD